MKHLANKIKKIRNENNLSQNRFGNKIGVSGKTISAYETGKITPPYKILERISEVYDTNLMLPINKHKINMRNQLNVIEDSIRELKEILSI